VCKSLLGKAHTVMAEGGIAAAWPTSTSATAGRSTSPTPCAAASTSAPGGWPSCTRRKRRPGPRVEAWARSSTAPRTAASSSATSAATATAAGARRRSHRAGDDPDAPGPRIHQGIEVHMEHTVLGLLKDGERVSGAFGYDRERGLFHVFRAARWCSPPAASARRTRSPATPGSTRETATCSPTTPGRVDGHGVRAVPSHRDDLAASVQGILVTEGVRGEGGVLLNSKGKRFLFDDIPRTTAARPPTRRRRVSATPRATRTPPSSRAAHPTTSPAASSARSRKGGAARTAACSSTSAG